MTSPTPTNLVTLDFAHMAALVARLGWPSYRTRQILQWIYQHRIRDVAGMSSLSLNDRETLGHEAVIERLASPTFFQSVDGTQKIPAFPERRLGCRKRAHPRMGSG